MATVFVEIGGQEMTQEQFEAARFPLEETITLLMEEADEAYREGKEVGYEDGYERGYESGNEDGYRQGYDDAEWNHSA